MSSNMGFCNRLLKSSSKNLKLEVSGLWGVGGVGVW